jgi:O-antigen ligase
MSLAAGAAVFIPQVTNRITYLFTSDYAEASQRAGRAGRWDFGIDLLIKNNPWLGFGMGRFGGAVAMQNQDIEGMDYFYMDNYYLKNLVELGYIGFAIYALVLVFLIWYGVRCIFMVKKEKAVSDISVGIFASMTGVMVHCYFENIFEVPYMNAYFWGMAALLLWTGFVRKPHIPGLNAQVPNERQ